MQYIFKRNNTHMHENFPDYYLAIVSMHAILTNIYTHTHTHDVCPQHTLRTIPIYKIARVNIEKVNKKGSRICLELSI